jgi:hypothetical protein
MCSRRKGGPSPSAQRANLCSRLSCLWLRRHRSLCGGHSFSVNSVPPAAAADPAPLLQHPKSVPPRSRCAHERLLPSDLLSWRPLTSRAPPCSVPETHGPGALIAAVPRLAESPQQHPHPRRKVGLGCFQQQMEMIAHQDPSMHPPTVAPADPFQPNQERLVVLSPDEKLFAPVSAGHHMIHRPGVLKSRLSRHGQSLPPGMVQVNPQF